MGTAAPCQGTLVIGQNPVLTTISSAKLPVQHRRANSCPVPTPRSGCPCAHPPLYPYAPHTRLFFFHPTPHSSLAAPAVHPPLPQTQAVAVGRGGIVPKSDVPLAGGAKPAQQGAAGAPAPADPSRQHRLCVEDPISGRDVASGSHQVQLVSSFVR
jgi:hypothetical protein